MQQQKQPRRDATRAHDGDDGGGAGEHQVRFIINHRDTNGISAILSRDANKLESREGARNTTGGEISIINSRSRAISNIDSLTIDPNLWETRVY